MSTTADQSIADRVAAVIDETRSIRHDLHANPEIRFREERTASVIRRQLEHLKIEHVSNLGGKEPGTGTGVVAHLPATTGTPGPCIALRADIDALPIQENSDLPYKSTRDGVMHACGHDGHTAILLGAAHVLSKVEHRPNPITFIFQPAEEGGAGAAKLIRDGALDGLIGPKAERIYGLHGWPTDTLGTISTKPGALLASTDLVSVTIHGTQAHAAYPHLSADPVLAGCAIIQSAQQVVSRNTDPNESVVVSFTTFHAGSAINVIPHAATIAATVRTLSDASRAKTKARLLELIEHTAKAHGCEAKIDWDPGYPVTRNDPDEAARVLEIARSAEHCARTKVVEHATLGGEDFAFYLQKVPGCFFFMGLAEDDQTPYPGLHTPSFNFNDQSLPLGVEMMCRLALTDQG